MTHTERALLTESVHDTLREQIFSGELLLVRHSAFRRWPRN